MELRCTVFLNLLLTMLVNGRLKRWLPNANFGNPQNWESGRIPCGNDIAVFHDDSPTVYLQTNTTLKELILPKTSDILLGPDLVLGFTNIQDNNPNCLSDGKEIGFNKTYPSDWYDPKNWCTSDSESGNCSANTILESEKVPCTFDDVLFPKDNSFFVNVEANLEIVINTLRINGKSYSTNSLSSFLNSDVGLRMFPIPHTGNRSKIKILRRPCNDPIGCRCGNDKPAILQRICSYQKSYCSKPLCKNSLLPDGGCCRICGAKMTVEYGAGFRFDTLNNGLRRNYLEGKEDLTDIKLTISRTSNDKIQLLLTDNNGGIKSIKVAIMMKNDIDQDILSGGFKYSLRKIALEQSGAPTNSPSTGARKGGQSSGKGGETAGIVIGVLVLFVAIVAGLFFLYNKKNRNTEVSRFKMFDRISFRRKLQRPQVEVPPFFGMFRTEPDNVGSSHQGFENPVYGNLPLGNEKDMNLEMMPSPLESEEQPTFDTSGFDNPLYDTYVQESPFSDATEVEPEKSKKQTSNAEGNREEPVS